MIKNKDLKRRIIDISYKHNLSHIGSCLTAVDIIDEIFSIKKKNEKFILSSGHAGLSLYCVLEKYSRQYIEGGFYNKLDAQEIFNHHGVHPDRCKNCSIDCSSGSLGQGLPIAIGMALADRSKNVYCLISDGECSEGSITESLRIAIEQKLDNLKVFINYNGYGAYKEIDKYRFYKYISPFWDLDIEVKETDCDYLSFLKGQGAHYYTMNENDYKLAMDILT